MGLAREERESPLRGLWMLPWRFTDADESGHRSLGLVNHMIMNRRYRCAVFAAPGDPENLPGEPAGEGRWTDPDRLDELPHSSLVDKALRLAGPAG